MSQADNSGSDKSNGIQPLSIPSNTRRAVEALITSAKNLSTDPTIGSILNRLDHLPALEREIKERSEQEKIAEKARMKALDDYNHHRDKWVEERRGLQRQVNDLKLELERSTQDVTSLQSVGADQRKRMNELENLLANQEKASANCNKQLQGLYKALETEKKKGSDLVTTLRDHENQASQADTKMKELQKAYSKLKNQADRDAQELQTAAKLTVLLKDDVQILEKVDNLWSDGITMICSFFWRDATLSESVTETFWLRIERLCPWSKLVPVPQSNTDAAKQMRCVIILAHLARKFSHNLFQPTYLLPPGSGIRDLLIQQAEDHAQKEATIRAQFQALLVNEQKQTRSKIIEQTCIDIMDLVAGLLPSKEEALFRQRLKGFAEEACEIWQEICRCTDAVQPRFDLDHYENWPWFELAFRGSQTGMREQNLHNSSLEEPSVLAIFPRLYTWYDNQWSPDTHGVILMKSQTGLAIQEMEKLPLSPRLDRSISTRNRRPRDRRASTSANLGQSESKRQVFLGTDS